MSFASDMARISAKFDRNLDEFGRAVKVEIFTGVIQDTRVDTGRLRGNWQMREGSPAMNEITRLDPSGVQAISEASRVTPYSVSYLTNNLPYAPVWEEKDAMVGRNVARVQRNVARKARELNR